MEGDEEWKGGGGGGELTRLCWGVRELAAGSWCGAFGGPQATVRLELGALGGRPHA